MIDLIETEFETNEGYVIKKPESEIFAELIKTVNEQSRIINQMWPDVS